MSEAVIATTLKRTIIRAGAQWVGLQSQRHIDDGPLVIFRDPITGSTCSLRAADVTVSAVLAKLKSKRKEFGL